MEKKNLTKKLGTGAAVVALSGFVPLPINAALAASAQDNLTINADVLQQLSVTASVALDFGSFVPTAATGNVVVSLTGSATPSNAKMIGSDEAAGGIAFGGALLETYVVKAAGLGTAGFQITDGGNTVTITKITIGTAANGLNTAINLIGSTMTGANTDTAQLKGNATAGNPVAGTLAWSGAAPGPGNYVGSLAITIER